MKRFDPLNPEEEAEPEPAQKQAQKRGTRSVKSARPAAQSNFDVRKIPLATFACLLGTSDPATAEEAREKFAVFYAAHPGDWRAVWKAFTAPAAGIDTGPALRERMENATARLRQYQPLTKSVPKCVRRVLAAHSESKWPFRTHLEAFEKAIAGHGEFSVRYEQDAYLPLCIEVLPWSPADQRPAVSVAHYGEQNGDAMRDPEVVFAVITPDEWLAYECQQDYSPAPYTCAFRDEVFYPKIAASINQLGNILGRNLVGQDWMSARTVRARLGNEPEKPANLIELPAEVSALRSAREFIDNL